MRLRERRGEGEGLRGEGRRAWPWWICAASALFGRSRRVRGEEGEREKGEGRGAASASGKAAGAAAASALSVPGREPAYLSPPLAEGLAGRLAAGEQSLLFLNRRGYAPLMLCAACGFRLCCPDCDAWLALHGRGRLLCHHCAHDTPLPEACDGCGTKGAWVACGPGVERVAGEVRRRFPSARVAVASSDTMGGDGGPARAL